MTTRDKLNNILKEADWVKYQINKEVYYLQVDYINKDGSINVYWMYEPKQNRVSMIDLLIIYPKSCIKIDDPTIKGNVIKDYE